eukprot:g5099.t1
MSQNLSEKKDSINNLGRTKYDHEEGEAVSRESFDNSKRWERSREEKKIEPVARSSKGTTSFKTLRRLENVKFLKTRKELPMYECRSKFLAALKECSTLVLVGETGSGKSTQIPQFLYEAGYCRRGQRVGITQPRRVAAMTVAKRVAAEMGVSIGAEVGYSVRFDDNTSSETLVKYLTDGMLLREAMMDPMLSKYSVLVLDEAHERSLHTDIVLGLVKKVQKERKWPLKIIVMSATLNAELFANYFDNTSIFKVSGRQYPVEILYTCEPEPDYLDAALISVLQIHVDEKSGGDILLFLSGQNEIEEVETLLHEKCKQMPKDIDKLIIRPIFAALPKEEQLKAFEKTPEGCRKVILATNIAESSITLPGVKYVIDPGMSKQRGYRAKTGMESLKVMPISQQQAWQRAGRAGREGPGKCFRLFEENAFLALRESAVPEILRCNLSTVVLQLKAIGVENILEFDFIEKPSAVALQGALQELLGLGALNEKTGHLTTLGERMAALPLEPSYAKLLIVSAEPSFQCLPEVLTLVALLSTDDIFFTPKDKREEANQAKRRFAAQEGDHLTLINAYDSWIEAGEDQQWSSQNFINQRSMKRAKNIRLQLVEVCHRQKMYVPESDCRLNDNSELRERVRKCLVSACFMKVATRLPKARKKDGSRGGHSRLEYKCLASGTRGSIHPSSVMFSRNPKAVIFNELITTTRTYMRCITEVDPSWLPELVPHVFRKTKIQSAVEIRKAEDVRSRMDRNLSEKKRKLEIKKTAPPKKKVKVELTSGLQEQKKKRKQKKFRRFA